MATPIDRLPSGDKSKTAKQNYVGIKYGNEKGSISMGHIDEKATTTSGIFLQTPDAEHSFTMDIEGKRKGKTILTSPSDVAVTCGMANEESVDSMSVTAENGNICITAKKGKIRMKCTDFELVTTGSGTDSGNVVIKAAETFQAEGKKITFNSQAYTKICGSGTVEVTANGILNIYGSIFKAVTDSIAGVKDSKFGGKKKMLEQYIDADPVDPYNLPG